MGNHRSAQNSANASRQGRASYWTDEREALLRALWADGLFAVEIAGLMPLGCTRNMVIAKARRLQLSQRKGWNGKHRESRVPCETREGAAA